MSPLRIIFAILLPPVAVALDRGLGFQFVLSVVLTLIGWLPGVIHAFWVLTRPARAQTV